MGMSKVSRELPARMEGVRRRLERWRRTRQARSRIPEPLWAAAVNVAGRFGIHRTAKTLLLDYYSLKRRVEREADAKRPTATKRRGESKLGVRASKIPAADPKVLASYAKAPASCVTSPASDAAATFVELPTPVWAACGECMLELERPGGSKMRVHLKGLPTPDLAAISRSLWQAEP